jgi:hypothetical protein
MAGRSEKTRIYTAQWKIYFYKKPDCSAAATL